MPRWFSNVWVPKLLLPAKKVEMFGPKTAILAPKICIFGIFLANINLAGSFGALLIRCWLWRAGCFYDRASTYFIKDFKKPKIPSLVDRDEL